MGQTLAKATQGGKKLEYNDVNKSLLDDIIEFSIGFPSTYPSEAKYVFNKPLTWETKLEPSAFTGKYEQRGDDLVSQEVSKDEKPLLRLHKDGAAYTLSVLTLEEVAHVLKVSGDNKVNEARACLEANPDPLMLIGGDRFASTNRPDDLTQYRMMDELYKESKEAEEDSEELNQKRLCLRLASIISSFDTKLLTKFIDVLSNRFFLTPAQVDQQVALLKSFSGEEEETHVLEDIVFTSDYKFQNGCRTSAWRQAHSEIAYIRVIPHDVDQFYVVATKTGFFEGEENAEETEKDAPFRIVGESFSELATLIKTKSPKFGDLFDKRDFVTTGKKEKEQTFESTQDNVDGGAPVQHKVDMQVDENDNRKVDKRSDQKRKLEPSIVIVSQVMYILAHFPFPILSLCSRHAVRVPSAFKVMSSIV